jgi:hypothetical protein
MFIKRKLRELLIEEIQSKPKITGLIDDYIFTYLYDGKKTDEINYIINSLPPDTKFVFTSLLNICDEIRKYNIDTGDVLNTSNWGFKPNGNLALFDIGFGDWFSEFDNKPMELSIQENEEKINKFKTLANKIAQKLNIKNIKYLGSGLNGSAFEIDNNKVLKITKDKSEAVNSNKILNKNLNYIANIYEIYTFNYDSDEYFVIILEKLNTDDITDVIIIYDKLKLWFKKKIGK